ncbi:hypothetical protein LCX93_05135 [Sulfurimonas sp. SWIR-19]|uniref:hypothetical protein n=1 Tax=Sulfurimonas sp. SWIR-19 TaxID=2878390 RepID=UPI001CF5818C|nr:hypothetical protein [Sulfurimonas sp. SWIR-19]UCN01303.1 hypothetical protein LCX93_05135 [Sulfurimonas sp. SWIR-19]
MSLIMLIVMNLAVMVSLYVALFIFGGSFISLFLSKWMAVRGMPEVGIFDALPNAFATGWDKNNSLVEHIKEYSRS